MLPDQRVGCCSCTCRESRVGDPWELQPFFCCVHSGTLARIFFARCSALQEVFFVAPNNHFSICVQQKVVFHDLHHYMFIDPFVHAHVNAISDPHTHTHTHTHIDETHNAPHTAHTNSHDICNCTACINNRHRQAHIDHDIQSTFHILPHIHNMCTQLITPCDTQQYVCNHIIVVCMLLKHSLVLFAHQLCFSSSTSQPQHVYNMLCCWCILAILCVLMHCNVWLCMQCQALHTFQQDLLSCVCMHVE